MTDWWPLGCHDPNHGILMYVANLQNGVITVIIRIIIYNHYHLIPDIARTSNSCLSGTIVTVDARFLQNETNLCRDDWLKLSMGFEGYFAIVLLQKG